MSSFWSLGESGKQGGELTFPLQRSEKAHQRPTALLFLHRRSFAKLPPSLSTFSLRTKVARKDESRTPIRRFWLPPVINRNPRDQARKRKLPRPGAMAMAHLEELLLNGRLRKSHLWTSRQRSERTSPKAQTYCAPIRYLRKEFLPTPASQNFLLYLQVPEES